MCGPRRRPPFGIARESVETVAGTHPDFPSGEMKMNTLLADTVAQARTALYEAIKSGSSRVASRAMRNPQNIVRTGQQTCSGCRACVSSKPKVRAQVYCSTRCRIRGWRKDSSEEACYGQKTIGEINGLRRGNSAQTAACSLEIAFQSTGHPTQSKRLHGAPSNILGGGGWRWPGSLPTTQAKIVRAEIGATVSVPPVEGGAV